LDLILTTDPDLVSDVQIAPNLGNSDHNMITFTVHYEHEVPTIIDIRSVRDYHRGDYEQIRLELIKTDWDHELSGNIRDGFEDSMFEAEAISLRGQGQFSSRPRPRPRPVSSRPKPRPVIMIVEKNNKMTFLIKIQLLN